jgi:hypothetical protein
MLLAEHPHLAAQPPQLLALGRQSVALATTSTAAYPTRRHNAVSIRSSSRQIAGKDRPRTGGQSDS